MEPGTTHNHSFVIRLWHEQTDTSGLRATLRGSIIHVPSGRRRSLTKLTQIITFIEPYIESMGVHINWRRALRRWLLAHGMRWHSGKRS